MAWENLSNEVYDLFNPLSVFDHKGPESEEYRVCAGTRGLGIRAPRKGGKQPADYETRPHRQAYKRAWFLANKEEINRQRRARRAAYSAPTLDSVPVIDTKCTAPAN